MATVTLSKQSATLLKPKDSPKDSSTYLQNWYWLFISTLYTYQPSLWWQKQSSMLFFKNVNKYSFKRAPFPILWCLWCMLISYISIHPKIHITTACSVLRMSTKSMTSLLHYTRVCYTIPPAVISDVPTIAWPALCCFHLHGMQSVPSSSLCNATSVISPL